MIGLAFRVIQKKRDTALACLSAMYVIGYIVWSVNAYKNNLGILPAFESQYFISGLFPFLTFVIAFVLIRISQKWATNITRYIHNKKAHTPAMYVTIGLYLIGGIFVGAIVYKLSRYDDSYGLQSDNLRLILALMFGIFSISFISKIILVVIIHHVDKMFESETTSSLKVYMTSLKVVAKQATSQANFSLASVLYLCAFVLSVYYSTRIYPNFPQELGGIRPKKVCIIFKKELNLLPIFTQIESQCTDTTTVNDSEYLAYYKNDEKILLKKYGSKQTIEIQSSEIEYIKWK